ncbi:hypothetical protein KAS41_01755 [Candidatus Parcubacteria bacterium]|nr:hypothetical protein [Candidatus Parcubacteria bacterium]
MFNKTKKSKKNRLAILMILFLFVFNSLGFNLLIARNVQAAVSPAKVDVLTDLSSIPNTISNIWSRVSNSLKWVWEKWELTEDKLGKHWAAVGFKAALHNFLRNLALETATWVASGDKGQKPMIFTSNWEEYMLDAADEAAGAAIMAAASQWDKNNAQEDDYSKANDEFIECQEGFVSVCEKKCGEIPDNFNLLPNSEKMIIENCWSVCEGDHSIACLEIWEKQSEDLSKKNFGGPTAGSAGSRYSKGFAGSIVQFLCEPDFNVKMRLTASLAEIQRPKAPKCTYSRASRNWDEFVNDPDFLTRFQGYWNPEENDIGIALTMHSDFLNSISEATGIAKDQREEGGGWKAITDKAGNILTPGNVVYKMGTKPIDEGTKFEEVFTGDIIADSVATFANTLMSKLINKWVIEGMAKLRGDDEDSDYNWLSGVDSAASRVSAARVSQGAKAAKTKYSKIFQPDYKTGGAYSILSKLLMCPDPENAGPTECVITQQFADAVQQELTVQEAINQGYISGSFPFGFLSKDIEPLYNQGYSYRNLVILRKYRVIPVGWELAASYIGNQISDFRIYNIQEIIGAFDDPASPFYQLIDPNWVLKAPEIFCETEGIGEKIISEEVSQGIDIDSDGDFDDEYDQKPRVNIMRDGYCADEQSCLKEDSKGNCLFYGYCSEERRIWDFQGDECGSYYNTCQSFASPKGNEVFYLKSTADYSGCGEENAGCEWHCASRNAGDDGWACLSQGWDLNLDNTCAIADGCEIADSEDIDQDGDTIESCVVPHKGIECALGGSKARLTINKDLVPNVNNDIYLNQKAESCSSSSEGCREYIRTKPNLGTNIITNSSFTDILETDIIDDGIADTFIEWTSAAGEASSASFIGNTAFRSLGGANLTKVIDTGYNLEGRKFSFSFYAQNCAGANFQFYIPAIVGSPVELISGNNDDWERFSIDYTFPTDGTIDVFDTELTISVSGAAGGIPLGCVIDSAQLEELTGDGYLFNYEDYHNSNSLYLKKAPDYYNCGLYTVYNDNFDNQADCETAGHFWRTDIERCAEDGSEQCANFALECRPDDVGCDLYEPTNGDPSIPGVVRSDDFCPETCNGYNTYKQEATFFESEKFPEFLIPNNEEECSAQYAGCSEFTNLDKLEEGGEAVEYYSYLRPCHEVNGDCATFYTWVGSEETGFQLVAHMLLDADSNGIPDNVYNIADAADIFGDCDNYDDAISNPECNEFYSEGNIISYRHYKNTVTCSNDCHPYRKTKSSQTDCVVYSAAGWDWGEWSANNECIYEALSEQGIACPTSKNDCYEYKGNTSNNIRKVIDSGFEQAVNNWGVGALSSESLIRGGHSLKINLGDEMNYSLKAHCDLGFVCALDEGCECEVNNETVCYAQNTEQTCLYKSLLGHQKTYFLSFWAKGAGSLTAKFSSAPAGEEFASGSVNLGPEWQEYSLGPVLVEWDMGSDDPASVAGDNILETLKISGFSGVSYIDNIILKEERDKLFLIRPDFWNVASICDHDHNGAYAPQYMLGCEEYKSEVEKQTVYLKSFNRLCGEDAAGCEALIDTFNSHSYLEKIFNLGDISEITVFGDKIDTLVNDNRKTCKSKEKGCVALGVAKYRYNMNKTTENLADDRDDLYQYETIYKINNPDEYSDTLCLFDNVGCGKFSSDITGDYYFKDPVSQRIGGDAKICEYKLVGGQTDAGWYLANTASGKPNCPLAYSDIGVEYAAKTCLGGGGGICETDADCPGGYCNNWTAVCPPEIDGCTEYVDPISSISKNIVFNGDFAQDVNSDGIPDGWQLIAGDYIMNVPIRLERDTLYTVLSNSNGAGSAVILENCADGITGNPIDLTSPDGSMDVSAASSARIVSDENDQQFSGRFYTGKISAVNCDLRVSGNLVPSQFVKILKTGIYYNIDSSIDKVECNGLVDYEKGCVLFNRREISGGPSIEDIIYDADRNGEDVNTPQSCLIGGIPDGTCDSNLLVKVKPTRTCGEWLYCKGTVNITEKDGAIKRRCTDIGACNSMNEQGKCDGFVVSEPINQTANATVSLDDIRDRAGYAKIGKQGVVEGYYPLQTMSQESVQIKIPNSNFELIENIDYPVGWLYEGAVFENEFSIISDPVSAQAQGLEYMSPEGRSFLSVGADYGAVTETISLIGTEEGNRYFVSAWVNTLNLKASNAEIQLREMDAFGNMTRDYHMILSVPRSDYWQFETAPFDVNSSTKRINLRLTAPGSAPDGNFYIDDIRIKPALKVGDTNIYAPQTCRSYPKQDALSCEYFSDAGIKNIGKFGYCLEYDRSPGNPNQCLLWWPIDKLSSEGIEETGRVLGYDGKFPVFYCSDMDANFDFVERRSGETVWSDTIAKDIPTGFAGALIGFFAGATFFGIIAVDLIPAGFIIFMDNPSTGSQDFFDVGVTDAFCGDRDYYVRMVKTKECSIREPITNTCLAYNYYATAICIPRAGGRIVNLGNTSVSVSHGGNVNVPNTGWYLYEGDLVLNEPNPDPQVRIYDYTESRLVDPMDYRLRCDKIYQAVSHFDVGENKAWTDRVRDGTEYRTGELGDFDYYYNSEDKPFGSMIPPEGVNPPFWDGNDATDILDPILFRENLSEGAVAGLPYGCSDDSTQGNTCGVIGRCSGHPELICSHPYPGGDWDHNDDNLLLHCPCNEANTVCETCEPISNLGSIEPDDAIDILKRIFAKSYGTWEWDNINSKYRDCGIDAACVLNDWNPPDNICAGTPAIRPAYSTSTGLCSGGDCFLNCNANPTGPSCDFCGVPPIVENIKVNGNASGNYNFTVSDDVNLEFNSIIDYNQLPLATYWIDWGDGTNANPNISYVSNGIQDRPDEDDPHSESRQYSYYEMLLNDASSVSIECGAARAALFGDPSVVCGAFPCCATQPRVRLKDNWDWCNGDTTRAVCDQWEEYNGYIIASEF